LTKLQTKVSWLLFVAHGVYHAHSVHAALLYYYNIIEYVRKLDGWQLSGRIATTAARHALPSW